MAKWRKSTTKKITELAIYGGLFRFSFSPVPNKIKSSASHHTKGILWKKCTIIARFRGKKLLKLPYLDK
jgi:hypothetical protein